MKVLHTQTFTLPYLAPAPALQHITIMAVLTEDAAASQAVYVSAVPDGIRDALTLDEYANRVAFKGAKQSYRNALAYFPDLKETEYRR